MKKNVKKSILMLFVLIGASQGMASDYSDAILVDNPIAYWRFNDPNASTTAIDETGNYNGTYIGAFHGSTIAGPAGDGMGANNYAVSFDGVDDWVDATTLGNLGSNLADGYTFEAWVKTTDTTVKALFATATGNQQIHLIANRDYWSSNVSGALEGFFRDNGVPDPNYVKSFASYDTGFNDGEWHHLVETMDAPNGTIKFYLDGQLLIMSPKMVGLANIFANFQYSLALGAYNSEGTVLLNWAGTMDEVAIYNSVLSPGQIATHYAQAAGIPPVTSNYPTAVLADNPVAYWRFNDPNASSTAVDATGIYNGTYNGAAHGPTIAGPALAGMGVNNYAVSFDGVDDWVDATTLGNLGSNLADGFTFEAWVNTTSTAVEALFSTVSTGSVTQQIHLLTNRDQWNANVSGALEAYYRDNAAPNNYVKWYANYNTGFNDGNWHHLVETMDAPNGTTILYLDGTPLTMTMKLTSSADTFVNFADFLAIGAYNSAGSVVLNWAGTMDEVAIYNSVLTPEQIAIHYAHAVGLSGCSSYLPADINMDCYVDIEDFAELVKKWLYCTDPANSNCIE